LSGAHGAPAGCERTFDGDAYAAFLAGKATVAPLDGFHVDPVAVNAILKPHQRDLVVWAVRGGRRAIFAAFGTGKTVIQLETVRLTLAHAGGRALIVCPLGVHQEFAHDAAMLGIELHRIRSTGEALELPDGAIAITNYEPVRDGKLDPNVFTVASLDEAAILRSFGSKTYQAFLTLFDQVAYRFVATATPSPNRFKELIHYAGFLGIMDTGQALTRFFKRDSTQANNLTLLESQERNFWLWLATWSAWLQSPADVCGCGCHPAGTDACARCGCDTYVLPALELQEHEIAVDHLARTNVERNTGQTYLLADSAVSLSAASREKRATIPARVEKLLEILARYQVSPADQAIVYCHLNDEQAALERALTDSGFSVSSIDGTMPTVEAERRLAAWKTRETAVLLGKPVMLGVGLNLQQANKMVFVGIDYRFHDTIQAVHRIHRFGQTRRCEVHLIYAESEREIRKALLLKWRQHEELTSTMSELIREHGLSRASVHDALTRTLGVERVEVAGDGWRLVNNDCVPEVASMDADSVGLIVTSIPFSNHYEYTPAYEDLGFTETNDHFWAQMDFLTPQLLRVLQPGRVYACHVKDRILFGNVTGSGIPTSSPFHAEAIQHGIAHGFDYLGMITVVTDVVRENNQTYRLGWSEQCKDGTKMGVGSPEYVLLFHKPQSDRSKGYADLPVVKSKDDYTRARWQVDAHAFWRSSGNRHLTPDELAGMGPDRLAKAFTEHTLQDVYDYESHVRIGEELDGRGVLPSTFMALAPGSHHPMVWHDVNRMRTLNGEQSQRGLAQHICPLQIDIVDRLIVRYSNEGDTVFDPFSGLGTVPLRALALDRAGVGVELNPGYFLDAVKYLEAESRAKGMPTLFDTLAESEAA
jgi:DNA modification methylase